MADPSATDRLPPAPPSERMQRLRVGITGLAAVVLIVLLATAIATGVRRTAAANQNATSTVGAPASANAVNAKSEPLAQLGVAPGGSSTNSMQATKPKR